MNRERDEPFLKRWSRRKRAAEQPGSAEAPSVPPETDAEYPPAEITGEETPPPESADAPAELAPTDADLPDPETLDRNSDFSTYLSDRVSSRLKRAAMRRLFSSPEFNVRDGLDDYDEDYTQFKSLGDTVTAHMRYHRERLQRRDEEAAEAEEARARDAHGQTDEPPGTEPTEEPVADGGVDHDTDHETESHTTAEAPERRAHERDADDTT